MAGGSRGGGGGARDGRGGCRKCLTNVYKVFTPRGRGAATAVAARVPAGRLGAAKQLSAGHPRGRHLVSSLRRPSSRNYPVVRRPATRDSEIGPATCTLCARTPFPRRARKRTIHPAAPPRRLTAPPRSPSTHLRPAAQPSSPRMRPGPRPDEPQTTPSSKKFDPRARLQDRPRAKFQSTYSTKSTNRSIIGCIGWLKIGALFRTGRRTVQNVPRAWHSPRPSSKRAHVRVCWPFRESSGAPR